MVKRIQWMGPWESVIGDDEEFKKTVSLKSIIDKKALKSFKTTIPEKLALYTFITNPKGVLFPIGKELWGYDNEKYLNWWQITAQTIWEMIKEKFKENMCEIADLKQAADFGLYSDDSLPEQFPGPNKGAGYWFAPCRAGSFEDRETGGWRWFGLIVDEWDGSWERTEMPKMDSRQQAKHDIRPKYYKSYVMKGNSLVENKKSTAYYARPANVRMINRRMYWPVITNYESSILRYKNASEIIINKLETNWTLAVWNSFNITYSSSKDNHSLIIKPELTISLGRFSDKLDAHKTWGKKASELHTHYEAVYNVQVGLTDKSMIHLNSYVKKQKSPIWKGDWQNIWDIISPPYEKLVSYASETLKDLMK
ncbi:MAG: hypothetical protein ACTSR8_08505 [Promethearchaeota archaeon]